jgi:8-oxo-dGTP diphosphatase
MVLELRRAAVNKQETYPNNYVLGFLFDESKEHVALIEKQSPEWQKGKLNGIGGKINPGEDAWQAMCREFNEETGYYTEDWRSLGRLHGIGKTDAEGFEVWLYENEVSLNTLYSLQSLTAERVMIFPVKEIPYKACIPNLSWLIPFCLYPHNTIIDVEYWW